MKNFLFVTKEGWLLDMAWKVKSEWNNVKMFIWKKSDKDTWRWFVRKSNDWEKDTDWADIIIFESIWYWEKIEELRSKWKLIIWWTRYTDDLENDRWFWQSELKRHNVKILWYKEFDNFDDAIIYVKENPGKYVIKPSGEIQDLKQLLFVWNEENGLDVIRILTAYKKTWWNEIKLFQIQKKVSWVEIAVWAFFNWTKFLKPININFEHKKLFPWELWVSTWEMWTTMFWADTNEIFDKTLWRFESKLAKEWYVWYIDLNCIVNWNGIFPLEFTCRFWYPTICIQQHSIVESTSDFLLKMAIWIDFKIKTRSWIHIWLMVVVPPFPFFDKKTFETFSKDSVVVFKDKPKKMDWYHLQELKLINKEWLICWPAWIALVVTWNWLTMKQAQKQAYSRVHNLLIANMYYRNDIWDRWYEDSDKLRWWGYL